MLGSYYIWHNLHNITDNFYRSVHHTHAWQHCLYKNTENKPKTTLSTNITTCCTLSEFIPLSPFVSPTHYFFSSKFHFSLSLSLYLNLWCTALYLFPLLPLMLYFISLPSACGEMNSLLAPWGFPSKYQHYTGSTGVMHSFRWWYIEMQKWSEGMQGVDIYQSDDAGGKFFFHVQMRNNVLKSWKPSLSDGSSQEEKIQGQCFHVCAVTVHWGSSEITCKLKSLLSLIHRWPLPILYYNNY